MRAVGGVLVLVGVVLWPVPAHSGPTETCLGQAVTISGTPGSDEIVGTSGNDVILARGGHDRIRALGGDDLICAGPGADTVRPGPGDDTIDLGRAGLEDADVVSYADADRGVRVEMASNGVGEVTGWGTDTLTENPFVIVVRGSDHDDVMIGGPDFDQLLGGPGVDRIRGGGSADLLTGGRGAGDVVRGQVGRDILGDAGRKAHLYGGPGADDLWGTKYADHLDGGAGNDEAFPRGGQDTCVSIEDEHGGCESSS